MKIFASPNSPIVLASFMNFLSSNLPVLISQKGILDCIPINLSIICVLDISKEKKATVFFSAKAAYLIISNAKDVLPTDGLAARIIRSDFWKPPNSSSKSLNPVEIPKYASSFSALSALSYASLRRSLIWTKFAFVPV